MGSNARHFVEKNLKLHCHSLYCRVEDDFPRTIFFLCKFKGQKLVMADLRNQTRETEKKYKVKYVGGIQYLYQIVTLGD